MTIRLQFDRIPPGTEIGPRSGEAETVLFVAAGELVIEGDGDRGRRTTVRVGDALYAAPADCHTVRNEGRIDALALLAAVDPEPDRPAPSGSGRRFEGEPVRRREGARVIEREGVRHRLLVEPGDFGTATFAIGEVELEPGATTGWHRHLRSEHVIVVLEGRGTLKVGAVDETLEPLKGVRVEMGLPHAITNTGRTRLRYYLCATPAADPLSDREDLDPET